MLDLDHIAITVNDLEKSILFYKKIGYKLVEKFDDDEYRWATLRLNNHSLELFESFNKENFDHIAYSFESEDDWHGLLESLGYKKDRLDVFFGDLNRESFFITDNNGKSIQLIKKVKK